MNPHARSQLLWGIAGSLLALALMFGVLGAIDQATGHHHHYGLWAGLMSGGVSGLGNMIGRAAA